MPPNAAYFEAPLEKALCVLAAAKGRGVLALDAATIARTLHDEHGNNVHWRTISAQLDKNRSFVSRRKKNKRWHYTILDLGEKRVFQSATSSVLLVEPSKAIQNVISLHDTLSGLSGTVRVCDPYLSAATIEHLDSCSSSTIRLLTHNIDDTGRLRSLVAVCGPAGKSIEIRKTAKSTIHDRYLIDSRVMLILGTSLNGFGKKECFIIKVGQDIRNQMVSAFDQHWSLAIAWP